MALIEAREPGANNSTPLTFTDVLKKYDIADCSRENYHNFIFDNFHGSSVEYILKEKKLVALDYKKACQKIHKTFLSQENEFQFIRGSVASLDHENDKVKLLLDGGEVIFADYVVDASGTRQIAANQFNSDFQSYYSHVYGGYFSGADCNQKDVCAFLLPNRDLGSGGGWFYSEAEDKASFGYAQIETNNVFDAKKMQAIFEKAKSDFMPYASYLKGADLKHAECGIIPVTPLKKFVYDRVVIVGDAAGMATNWTCMGVEPALEYGTLAGEIVSKAAKAKDKNLLCGFQDRWDKANRVKFDSVSQIADWYWKSGFSFWEFTIKCDLKYLAAKHVIDRLRHSKHLSTYYQLLFRRVCQKLQSLLNKKVFDPEDITINE